MTARRRFHPPGNAVTLGRRRPRLVVLAAGKLGPALSHRTERTLPKILQPVDMTPNIRFSGLLEAELTKIVWERL